ncbi:hypothetical protein [uncultured Corynebacterium sp.]|uniref:hypothetical protein n=1 Tax=uncultured Corynebacterium sp. TaxID=159447 RepID=UPI002596B033|nr:hypothetical protein [uncultured Corynebacterium sp.]
MTQPAPRAQRPRRSAIAAALCCAALALAGCSTAGPVTPLGQARNANQSRHISERFEQRPVVIDDPAGIETARLLFDASETLVVTDATPEAQLRGASIAVVAHAPMLIYDPARHDDIVSEIKRMKTYTVLTVGDVSLARSTGAVRIFRDPGGFDALAEMTTFHFGQREVAHPAQAAEAVAQLRAADPTWLRASWAEPKVLPGAQARPFPVHSRRDADMAPVVVATAESPIPAVANLRSFGAAVTVVPDPDPRAAEETLMAVAGLAQAPLIALGPQFGSAEELEARIMQAEERY